MISFWRKYKIEQKLRRLAEESIANSQMFDKDHKNSIPPTELAVSTPTFEMPVR
jgi:hypothetical protein